MLSSSAEKKWLQLAVTFACVVPITGGVFGMLEGAAAGGVNLDSHVRYLSGLLMGIGLGFLSAVPRIEEHAARFRLLTLIVLIGGAGRLAGFALSGIPGPTMQGALVMELVVTPLLCLWQNRVARRAALAD